MSRTELIDRDAQRISMLGRKMIHALSMEPRGAPALRAGDPAASSPVSGGRSPWRGTRSRIRPRSTRVALRGMIVRERVNHQPQDTGALEHDAWVAMGLNRSEVPAGDRAPSESAVTGRGDTLPSSSIRRAALARPRPAATRPRTRRRGVQVIGLALDRLSVEFGPADPCDRCPPGLDRGRCTAVVDTARTNRQGALPDQPLRGGRRRRDRGADHIASTWEGILAAEVLEREGIHCNSRMLFGMAPRRWHAPEAGVDADQSVRRRILDWYTERAEGRDGYPRQKTRCRVRHQHLQLNYRAHGYKTGHGGQLPQP